MKGYEGGLALFESSTRIALPDGLRLPDAEWRAVDALLSDPTRPPRDARGRSARIILRKEVIQPQVPLRLPCYDFTPVTEPTVVGCLLTVGAPPSGNPIPMV